MIPEERQPRLSSGPPTHRQLHTQEYICTQSVQRQNLGGVQQAVILTLVYSSPEVTLMCSLVRLLFTASKEI